MQSFPPPSIPIQSSILYESRGGFVASNWFLRLTSTMMYRYDRTVCGPTSKTVLHSTGSHPGTKWRHHQSSHNVVEREGRDDIRLINARAVNHQYTT